MERSFVSYFKARKYGFNWGALIGFFIGFVAARILWMLYYFIRSKTQYTVSHSLYLLIGAAVVSVLFISLCHLLDSDWLFLLLGGLGYVTWIAVSRFLMKTLFGAYASQNPLEPKALITELVWFLITVLSFYIFTRNLGMQRVSFVLAPAAANLFHGFLQPVIFSFRLSQDFIIQEIFPAGLFAAVFGFFFFAGFAAHFAKRNIQLGEEKIPAMAALDSVSEEMRIREMARPLPEDFIAYRESRPGVAKPLLKMVRESVLKSAKIQWEIWQARKNAPIFLSQIGYFVVGFDYDCLSVIFGVGLSGKEKELKESFYQWAFRDFFEFLLPGTWDLDFEGRTTLEGIQEDFSDVEIISLT